MAEYIQWTLDYIFSTQYFSNGRFRLKNMVCQAWVQEWAPLKTRISWYQECIYSRAQQGIDPTKCLLCPANEN